MSSENVEKTRTPIYSAFPLIIIEDFTLAFAQCNFTEFSFADFKGIYYLTIYFLPKHSLRFVYHRYNILSYNFRKDSYIIYVF